MIAMALGFDVNVISRRLMSFPVTQTYHLVPYKQVNNIIILKELCLLL